MEKKKAIDQNPDEAVSPEENVQTVEETASKTEELKTEEPKAEEPKAEEKKTEEPKAEEPSEVKAEAAVDTGTSDAEAKPAAKKT